MILTPGPVIGIDLLTPVNSCIYPLMPTSYFIENSIITPTETLALICDISSIERIQRWATNK